MTPDEKASLLNGIDSAAYGDSHNGYYVGNVPGVARLGVPSINMQDASQVCVCVRVGGRVGGWVHVRLCVGVPSMNMQDASQINARDLGPRCLPWHRAARRSVSVNPTLSRMTSQGFRTIDKSQFGQVTSWPCGLAVTGAWDVGLMRSWAEALGKEFRSKGANMILGPSINVHRVAKNGRNAEYISGESPYLGSQLVPAYVQGVQSQKVMANVKHFILNNQETNRGSVSSNVGERALHQVYMAPFRAGILAGAATAMCSYNRVNGTYSYVASARPSPLLGSPRLAVRPLPCGPHPRRGAGRPAPHFGTAHPFPPPPCCWRVRRVLCPQLIPVPAARPRCGQGETLNRALKADLNFSGFVTSDWGAVHADGCQAAGLDMDQPGTDHYFDKAKLTGDAAALDDMAARVVTALDMVGALDDSVCTGGKDCGHYLYEANATSTEHATLARTIAAQSAALLKNDNATLPVRPGATVRVVGEACDAPYNLAALSQWNVGNYYVMGGSGRVINPVSTSILAGLRQRARRSNVTVLTSDTPAAAAAAAAAGEDADVDLIITCGASWSSEGADRTTLKVDQDAAIAQLVAQAKAPVAVLLTAPGALVTSSFDGGAAAVVSMFLAGQATGLAWADVLFGDVNPSGRLPVTFLQSEADAVEPCPGVQCDYTEGLAVGYRGLWGKPVAYPFGHGLSYTAFKYSAAAVVPCPGPGGRRGPAGPGAAAGGDPVQPPVCVGVTVANDGAVPGAEVAQLYLTFPADAGEPSPALRGFAKTAVLKPGASEDVVFRLSAHDLSVYDVRLGGFAMASGAFEAAVGASSRDTRATVKFTV